MRDLSTRTRARRSVSAVVLALMAGVLLVAAPAVAGDEPPIVTVGPIEVAGNGVSGTVQPDPEVDVCISDQHSEADANDRDPIKLNDASCRATSGSGTQGPGGTQGANGAGAGPSGFAGATGATGAAGAAGTSGKSGKASATTVSATDALGLRIVGVRKVMKNVQVRRSFRLLVTLRDVRGSRVFGAFVAVSGVAGTGTPHCGVHANFSNRSGVSRVLVPVTTQMFGKRLYLKIAARTPKARAVALRSVLLPRLR